MWVGKNDIQRGRRGNVGRERVGNFSDGRKVVREGFMKRSKSTFPNELVCTHSGRGGKAGKTKSCGTKKVAKPVTNGRDMSERMHEIYGGGTKKAPNFTTPFILRNLENLDERLLSNVSKPYLGAVGKSRYDDGKKNLPPGEKRYSSDGITYD